MRRFILPPSWDGGPRCQLGHKDAKRLARVLRLAEGDRFPGATPDGRPCTCTIESLQPETAILSVELSPEHNLPGEPSAPGTMPGHRGTMPPPDLRGGRKALSLESPPIPAFGSLRLPGQLSSDVIAQSEPQLPRLVLALAHLKGSKLDDIVRISAESGVSRIVLVTTERSVPRGTATGRMERYERIIAEARGQSGSLTATTVHSADSIRDFALTTPADGDRLGLVFHEAPLASAPLHRYCAGTHTEVVACIGPEGGFSDAELADLAAQGYASAWLGPSVLRAETAAIFALSAIRTIFLERYAWSPIK